MTHNLVVLVEKAIKESEAAKLIAKESEEKKMRQERYLDALIQVTNPRDYVVNMVEYNDLTTLMIYNTYLESKNKKTIDSIRGANIDIYRFDYTINPKIQNNQSEKPSEIYILKKGSVISIENANADSEFMQTLEGYRKNHESAHRFDMKLDDNFDKIRINP